MGEWTIVHVFSGIITATGSCMSSDHSFTHFLRINLHISIPSVVMAIPPGSLMWLQYPGEALHKVGFCSFLDESSAQETRNVLWLGVAKMLYVLFTRCWAKQSRNPSSCWDLFWPCADPSRTQTNFLVDNKQFLSQNAVQLRVQTWNTARI